MTIIDSGTQPEEQAYFSTSLVQPETATGDLILDQYDTPFGDQQIVVIGPTDHRVKKAFEIERDNMVLLGETEENADADLRVGFSDARFLTLYNKGTDLTPENMLGVVRVTDASPITRRLITIEQVTTVTHESYDEVFAHVINQTGESDPSKIFDINTYGMSEDIIMQAFSGNKQPFRDAKESLMYAMCREGIRANREQGATTALAFFTEISINAFTSRGYDWKPLNGYQPMNEERETATGELVPGPMLLPTVLNIPTHIDRMRTHVTEHLGNMASFMLKNGVDLTPPVVVA